MKRLVIFFNGFLVGFNFLNMLLKAIYVSRLMQYNEFTFQFREASNQTVAELEEVNI